MTDKHNTREEAISGLPLNWTFEPLILPSFLSLLPLVCRGRTSCGTTPPTKLIPPPMPDGVSGSPHSPVLNPPAFFDLPGLAVDSGDDPIFCVQGLLQTFIFRD